MACAILGSAAIVSTGFAAWVITIDGSATLDGNIEVDTVSDKSLFIEQWENETYKTEANVAFTADVNEAGENFSWLKGEGAGDDLSATFYVKVTIGKDRLAAFDTEGTGGLTARLSSSKYDAAAAKNYVAPMPTVDSQDEKSKIDISEIMSLRSEDKLTRYYQISISFNWGTYFNSMNPTKFYNQGNYDDTRADIYPAATYGTTKLLEDVQNVLINDTAYTGLEAEGAFSLIIEPKTKTSA